MAKEDENMKMNRILKKHKVKYLEMEYITKVKKKQEIIWLMENFSRVASENLRQ